MLVDSFKTIQTVFRQRSQHTVPVASIAFLVQQTAIAVCVVAPAVLNHGLQPPSYNEARLYNVLMLLFCIIESLLCNK